MHYLNRVVVQLVVLVWVVGLMLVGCGSDDAEDDVSGNYRGTIQDSLVGSGTITATLAEDDGRVTGTFQTSFPQGNGGGNVSGSRTDNALTLTVIPTVATVCPVNVTATIDGDEIRGTYAAFSCSVAETGNFTMTLQD
jgi:hypothetical protein